MRHPLDTRGVITVGSFSGPQEGRKFLYPNDWVASEYHMELQILPKLILYPRRVFSVVSHEGLFAVVERQRT